MSCSETIVQDIETNSFRYNVSYHLIFTHEAQLLSFSSDHRALSCIKNISNLTYLYASLLRTRKLFHRIQLKMKNLFCNVISCFKLFFESNNSAQTEDVLAAFWEVLLTGHVCIDKPWILSCYWGSCWSQTSYQIQVLCHVVS